MRSERAALLHAERLGLLPSALADRSSPTTADSLSDTAWAHSLSPAEREDMLQGLFDALCEETFASEAASIVEAERLRLHELDSALALASSAPLEHSSQFRVLCPVCCRNWLSESFDRTFVACTCGGLRLHLPQRTSETGNAMQCTPTRGGIDDLSASPSFLSAVNDRLNTLIMSHQTSECTGRVHFQQLAGTGLIATCVLCGLHKVAVEG